MEYLLQTSEQGSVALSDHLVSLKKKNDQEKFYRIIWVRSGELHLEIDHVQTILSKGDLLSVTPLREISLQKDAPQEESDYLVLSFNSNFYCIYNHTDDVSCSGVLFHGSSHLLRLSLSEEQCASLEKIVRQMPEEFSVSDNLHEEMLRLLLKRFIITCTRIAREQIEEQQQSTQVSDLVRRYYMLVDEHFKQKHRVTDYAEMLNRSPKTLSNLFAQGGFPSPLKIIRERTVAEARRLLLHTPMRAKEIAEILGFEDTASFSRFFHTMTGMSISEFRTEAQNTPCSIKK